MTGTGDATAIIGMACLFPGAPNLDAYWNNILNKVDAVSDPPAEAWDTDLYYAPESTDTDRVYCKRGGYLGSLVSFDPLPHGIPPVSVGGEPDQWLAFQLARDAIADAGYTEIPADIRRRTAVVLGKGTYLNGGNAIAVEHGLIIGQTLGILKRLHPEYTDQQLELIRIEMKKALPPLNSETVPGLIPNITVGRIANRLDLMGPTYTIDAACASSLVALQIAVRDLQIGDCDLAIVGGSQVWVPVPTLNVFCQLGALSHRQQIRPFDKDADGTLLGEGIGMVVLKRLQDADRDGDRVYAVIRGVGVASDGRGAAVMAPRLEGEELALRRAYAAAGVSPDTIELIEAHGTGTPVGDAVEVEALTRVFGSRVGLPHCALGSVKSMISHTMPAAGIAGIIKASLALYHKVLPPTLNCDEPNPKLHLDQSRFYLNTDVRPWVHGAEAPRRAGVNAFGFGGINAHVVLEESPEARLESGTSGHAAAWDSEVFIFQGESPPDLLEHIHQLAAFVGANASEEQPSLKDVAYSVNYSLHASPAALRLAVIATTPADLLHKLDLAVQRLSNADCRRIKDVSGIYFTAEPLGRDGRLALLFPGEGAQYRNMLASLCLHFPEARAAFDRADQLAADDPRGYRPSDFIFPRPEFSGVDRTWADDQLTHMDEAIEAVLSANQALYAVLSGLGLRPDVLVGHSTGDYSALAAAGVLDLQRADQQVAFKRALACGRNQTPSGETPYAALLVAVGADRPVAEAVAREAGGDLCVAMHNCPHQTVLIGDRDAGSRAIEVLRREGLIYEMLSFDRPYHTPAFASEADRLGRAYAGLVLHAPRTPVYSCTTTAPLPTDADQIRRVMVDHWVRPVEFQRTVERLYADGVRLFVEAGPRGNLTAFVEDTLRGKAFCAVAADVQRRSGTTQLNHLVGLLAVHGVNLDLEYLYQRRSPRLIDWQRTPHTSAANSPRTRVALATGWPMLRLTRSAADRVRSAAPAASPDTDGAERVAAEQLATLPSSPLVLESPPHASKPDAAPAPWSVVPMVDSAGPPSHVMQEYLHSMDAFLSVQERVMRAYLSPAEPASAGGAYPLLGSVVSEVAGEEFVSERDFDLAEDVYLRDHTLGRELAIYDEELRGLAVMPLTMSLELLAEAGAYLAGGLKVVGLRDVRAHRWLTWEQDHARRLQVRARRVASPMQQEVWVAAEVRDLTAADASDSPFKSPTVQATIVLAAEYQLPPAPRIPGLAEGEASRWRSDELYSAGMFHGPAWQCVTDVEQSSSSGTIARLRVLPRTRVFASQPAPKFVLDPVVLDGAGQVVGFWTQERLASRQVIFPIQLDALDVFGPCRPVGEQVACVADIQLVGDSQVRSNIDVIDADGALWMRLSGWADKRFDVPRQFYPLILAPEHADISTSCPRAVAQLSGGLFECRHVGELFDSDRAFWKQVWANCTLGRTERELWRQLRLSERGQLEWLAARTAAKEAVRAVVRQVSGLLLRHADIEIVYDRDGRPFVQGSWLSDLETTPRVSLAYRDGWGIAVAGLGPGVAETLEIDVEQVMQERI